MNDLWEIQVQGRIVLYDESSEIVDEEELWINTETSDKNTLPELTYLIHHELFKTLTKEYEHLSIQHLNFENLEIHTPNIEKQEIMDLQSNGKESYSIKLAISLIIQNQQFEWLKHPCEVINHRLSLTASLDKLFQSVIPIKQTIKSSNVLLHGNRPFLESDMLEILSKVSKCYKRLRHLGPNSKFEPSLIILGDDVVLEDIKNTPSVVLSDNNATVISQTEFLNFVLFDNAAINRNIEINRKEEEPTNNMSRSGGRANVNTSIDNVHLNELSELKDLYGYNVVKGHHATSRRAKLKKALEDYAYEDISGHLKFLINMNEGRTGKDLKRWKGAISRWKADLNWLEDNYE